MKSNRSNLHVWNHLSINLVKERFRLVEELGIISRGYVGACQRHLHVRGILCCVVNTLVRWAKWPKTLWFVKAMWYNHFLYVGTFCNGTIKRQLREEHRNAIMANLALVDSFIKSCPVLYVNVGALNNFSQLVLLQCKVNILFKNAAV